MAGKVNHGTVKVIIDFIKLMKIDLCLSIFICGFIMQNVTVVQLMEDKMCRYQLNLDEDFCRSFTTDHFNTSETKNILRKANMFKNNQFLIIQGPGLIVSIFLGYWLGNFPKYIRMMVILPLVAAVCMDLILLLNAYILSAHWWLILLSYGPISITGSTCLIFSAAYTYISWSSPKNLMIVRFLVIEFVVQAGGMLGVYFGGKILSLDPLIKGQPKNYFGVFLACLTVNLTGVLIAFSINLDRTPTTDPEKDKLSFMGMISDVFKISRFRQPVIIFLKKRPSNGRLRLTLLISSGAVALAAILGEDGIAYQFAQRVYGLTEAEYTSIFALVTIIPIIVTSIGPIFLKSFLGLSDPMIGIIGSLSLFLFFLIRGIILTVPGYIAGYLLGSFNRLVNASVRTIVTAVVNPCETAQVFTLATALENYVSLGSTFFFTSVFSLTIDQTPGTVLILVAILQLYPLVVFVWLFATRTQWQPKKSIDATNIQISTISSSIITTVMPTERRQSVDQSAT